MGKLHRRDVIRGAVQVVSVFAVLPLVSARTKAAESCVESASESLRNSLQYSDPAPDSSKSCSGCAFFTPDDGSSCGQCVIMSGPVSESGWCESWSARS